MSRSFSALRRLGVAHFIRRADIDHQLRRTRYARSPGNLRPRTRLKRGTIVVPTGVSRFSLLLGEGGDELAVEVWDVGHDAAPDRVISARESPGPSRMVRSGNPEGRLSHPLV